MYSSKKGSISKRKKIVDVVVTLMDEQGLKNVTIQDICEKANISVGTFYHYFNSKESIPVEMYKLLDQYLLDHKEKMLSHPTAKEVLLDFVSHYGMYVSKWGYYANYIIVRNSVEGGSKKSNDEIRKINELLMDLIQIGIQQKEFKINIGAEQLKTSILLLMRGVLLEWVKSGPEYKVHDELVNHVCWFIDGIQC